MEAPYINNQVKELLKIAEEISSMNGRIAELRLEGDAACEASREIDKAMRAVVEVAKEIICDNLSC